MKAGFVGLGQMGHPIAAVYNKERLHSAIPIAP